MTDAKYDETPATVFSDFERHKQSATAEEQLTDSTLQNYRTAWAWFTDWWDDIWTERYDDKEYMSDCDGRAVREYARWVGSDNPDPVDRSHRSHYNGDATPDMSRSALKTHLTCIQKVVSFGESENLIDEGVADQIPVPKVSTKEERRETKLEPERAEKILDHLETYKPYSRDHAMFTLMTRYGLRRGSIVALDTDHFHPHADTPYLETVHRPEYGLGLKNGDDGERHMLLDGYTLDVLRGWIRQKRPDTTDEHGLDALFSTTQSGRVCKSVVYRTAKRLTCPDFVGDECDCDACPLPDGEQVKYKCERSRSPHECRSGFITGARNDGTSLDAISHRVNASPRTIESYYDLPDKKAEMERHAGEWG